MSLWSRASQTNPQAGAIGRIHRVLRFFLAVLMCVVPLFTLAQAPGGSITGTIRDDTGSVIPGVQISIKDVSTGQLRTTLTDSSGSYSLPALPVGNYELMVSAGGFVTQVLTGITVAVGSERVLDIQMRPGNSQAVVRATVSGAPSNQSSGKVDSSVVENTPLNGRDWAHLATLQAGVTGVQTGSASEGGNVGRGFGAAISISGARPDQNSYRLDGISINDYSNGAPGSVLGDNLGIDAVEQVSVLGSNYPAEYGRTSGGVINAVTRSGAKEFHGDVYEFFRNSALDARNFFDGKIPPFKRNQFGGSAGGPIQKDRMFIFGDYEGLRQSLGVTQVDTVPSAAARAGNLSSGSVAIDPGVLRFVHAFFPLPNGSLLGSGDTGIYAFSGQQVTPENYFTTRIDHRFSERDALSGTYMFDSGTVRQPDELNNKLTGYHSRRQFFTVSEAHTFNPRILNSIRLGIYRVVATTGLTFAGRNQSAGDSSFGTVPGHNAAEVTVPGVTAFTGGLGTITEFHFHWTSIQAYDDVSWVRGSHALRFGLGIERIRDNKLGVSTPGGQFLFNSISDFLTNKPFSLAA